jgi:hypothetical protein
MRFFAVHNAAGQIAALISIPQDDSSLVGMTLEAGQSMTEVEVSQISYDLDPSSVVERAAEVVKNFRVEVEPVQGKLVRMDDAEPASYS